MKTHKIAEWMKVLVVVVVVVWLGTVGVALSAGQLEPAAPLGSEPRVPAESEPRALGSQRAEAQAMLDDYCITCHNDAQWEREMVPFSFEAVDFENSGGPDPIGAHPDLWERVVRKMRLRMMPPPGRPSPAAAVANSFVTWVETSLDQTAAAHPNPGRPAVRRLTTAEYRHAIRSLFDLDIDERWLLFPADDLDEQGFGTNADVLSVSPALFDRYLSVANRVSRLVVGDPTIGPSFASATYSTQRLRYQDDRAGEDMPFGSRGGLAIHHYFPLDGEYEVKVRLRRMIYDYVVGMGTPQDIEIRLDGAVIKRFTVGGADRLGYPSAYTFFGTIRGDPAWEEYVSRQADAGLVVSFPARAGKRVLSVSFVQARTEPTGILERRLSGFSLSGLGFYDGNAAVERVEVTGPRDATGPGDTASRRRIFQCYPSTQTSADAVSAESCARDILSALARRAYRRPVTNGDVDVLMSFYDSGQSTSESGGVSPGALSPERFERGIQKALERLLVSPEFLFRVERDPVDAVPGTAYRLDDLELATRLSLFLWSDIPDDELLSVAEDGRLSNAGELERQVVRMLASPRASALVEEFASQWLHLRRVRGVAPDGDVFYDFDENLRAAMEQETVLFLESQLRDDRGLPELLTANYTFLNERLARHYGIENVYGERFRRVTFRGDAERQRGGLLGQASVLTLTSYPTRTSPVLRGKWVLDNILGMPPPPPPPDVPDLEDNHGGAEPRSVRARLEQHRANPACASCHRVIDPLGFALEHYDAVGRWRTQSDGGTPVDATGVLTDGTRVNGLGALRDALVGYEDSFVRTMIEKLMTYALGRSIEYYDWPAIRQVVTAASSDDYRWSSILIEIIKSTPFQMRRTES